ncbi:MAG TPA: beta-eliminating lyase-related protein [Flexivirga sp.]|uniref:threonine aldolase family protein n=1 Tax=Flexivirga sp. TaxID=1962927 RepID=UPI002B983856|nr:beta-eliminating lyase-related protein [Flexivirga sp.]HWC24068.1 beta-eliminating lyase-related protein [Flexivirga sp.]
MPTASNDTSPGTSSRAERFAAAAAGARRMLGHQVGTPGEALATVAESVDPTADWDMYGEGCLIAELESRVAELLGKPAVVFFPSGVMAQQAALRCWTDRSGSRRVAIPDLSHLLRHELDGPALLHDLRYERLGAGRQLPTVDQLDAIPGRLGAALLELPLREAGFVLPTFAELVEFSKHCRDRAVPLHLDGARLWESTPHLGRSLADVAALADSVYVSFYKGLGAFAGAALAGPEDLVAEARQWRRRLGGTLYGMTAYAASALAGLDEHLPRMAEYHDRAVELAALLSERGFRVIPDPPHTREFVVYAPGAPEALNEKVIQRLERDRVVSVRSWTGADVPGWSWTEVSVGSATMQWSAGEVVDALASVLEG